MKVVAIVQARMGSIRLPGKVMKIVNSTPLLGLLLARLNMATSLDEILVATTSLRGDDPIDRYVRELGYNLYRGDEFDVLDRYYRAASEINATAIVRITADCPLIDPSMVDDFVQQFINESVDYLSNTISPTYPDGLDIEIFSMNALALAWKSAISERDREHVTTYIKESDSFSKVGVVYEFDHSTERWTVDESEDFQLITKIFDHFEPRLDFKWQEVLELPRKYPEWFMANDHLSRGEGEMIGSGQKLWHRAKRSIPGGTMLLSKRPEMFLPDGWPTYFSRASGAKVWDLDGREYFDMSTMGVGTNILGYAHPEVDDAARGAIANGNMSTLLCPEEVYLAERLVGIHPWADMARLARTGGEACAIAVRISRAAARRENVAVCGYHGWHDWYLAANLAGSQELSTHLLPGLEPAGVPKTLTGTVHPFDYNDLSALEDLIRDHDVGVIMMEVERNIPPQNQFLSAVRQLATDNDVVLIFDECTSGFRSAYGGLHLEYDVNPDIAVLGKALGNGYAISAVIGRKEIMDVCHHTFISSTFWTERIGPVAALATLDIMERDESWITISETGKRIAKEWQDLGNKYNLPITVRGIAALPIFNFMTSYNDAYRTLISQELLKSGFIAANSVYVCTEHTSSIVDQYIEALDPIFGLIAECESGKSLESVLTSSVCHTGFHRLN